MLAPYRALAGTSSQGATHHSDNLIGSLGLSCVRGANLEGTFGKDSPLATGIAATPATDVHSEDHRTALDRKVLQRTPIAAMARARNGLATRTNSRVLTVSLHDPTLFCLEHAAKRQLANCVRADLSTGRHVMASLAQMESARLVSEPGNYEKYSPILIKMFQSVITGQTSPEEAAKAAEQEVATFSKVASR